MKHCMYVFAAVHIQGCCAVLLSCCCLQLQCPDQMKAVGTVSTVWSSETVAPGDHSHPVNIRGRATLADWDPARKGHHPTRLMRKQTILVLHFLFLGHNFYFLLILITKCPLCELRILGMLQILQSCREILKMR